MERTPSNPIEAGPAWRCLEELELAGGAEFRERLEREFAIPPGPEDAARGPDEIGGMARRDFLRLLGGTFGLAGLAALQGCTVRPRGKIVPYVHQPEMLVPGKAVFYATSLEFAGFGRGVLVETHEGRPTKIEGNPGHPASLGATSVFEQAALLDLYNPARATGIVRNGEPANWPAFLGELRAALETLPPGGAGLHLLTGAVTSPSFAAVWGELSKRYPEARWHAYEPLNHDSGFAATAQAFGRPMSAQYRFDQAATVVSLGCDFLFALPGSVRHARDFVRGRFAEFPESGAEPRNRLFVVESIPTITGTFADERRAVAPREMKDYASALASKLGVPGAGEIRSRRAMEWAGRVAGELQRRGGIVLAGMGEPPEVHARVLAANAALDAKRGGGLVGWTDPVEASPVAQGESLRDLAEALHAGRVRILLMLGGLNWARTAPGDLNFAAAVRRAVFSVHCGLYRDDTAREARWHVPQAHALETWGDTRAFDGTASLAQPMIEPLYGGRSPLEILDAVARFPGRGAREIVRDHWLGGRGMNEAAWRQALHDGFVANTAAPWQAVIPAPPASVASVEHPPPAVSEKGDPARLELVFTPDGSLWDGRHAENPWLQELPRPITKLSWENAFLLAPSTAKRLGVDTGDVVRVRAEGGRLEGAVLVQPGVADGTAAVALGGGLGRSGRRGESRLWPGFDPGGVDAYPLRTLDAPWYRPVTLEKTGSRREVTRTQLHHLLHGRDLLRVGTREQLLNRYPRRGEPPTLYNLTGTITDGHAWAMSIDLSRCIACNACMAACQAENNIPPVGREEVGRGREMHWIRIDTYYFGDPDAPFIAHQPVTCMHCELAPCEPVCPVAATVHDHDGLNLQIYNRCIGTRYCSNNCPYKVRRFNFFRYAEPAAREPLLLMANPNVTVRARGVMEKCTYCVQRISRARIDASRENRPPRDGEVTPACAQACPTGTIVFGDRSDPQSRVAKLKELPLDYAMLEDQNTRPRTTYLPRLLNPLS